MLINNLRHTRKWKFNLSSLRHLISVRLTTEAMKDANSYLTQTHFAGCFSRQFIACHQDSI